MISEQKPKSVLLHVCCGPCALMPILKLREQGLAVTAYFFNPNIHPQAEYDVRREAMSQAANRLDVPVLWEPQVWAPGLHDVVDPKAWVKALGETTAEGERCVQCYDQRLQRAARVAAEQGFDSFTTSLLYSRYQHHEAIQAAGKAAAQAAGTNFLYRDFRHYWQEGINLSKELGLYRQKWCGCILSKAEAEQQRAEREARKAEKVGKKAGAASA